MRLRWLSLLLCSGLVSCDKLKESVAKVSAKVAGEATVEKEGLTGPLPGGEVDPALAAHVDENEQGVLLRKDLPYPSRLSVRQTQSMTGSNLRVVRKSALGTETAAMNGTIETENLWERAGDTLTLTIGKSGFVPTATDEDKKKPVPAPSPDVSEADSKVGMSGAFHWKGNTWKAEKPKGDFGKVVWLQRIENSIGELAVDSGALPRTHWFGKRRFKVGDSFTLSGDGLNVVFPGAEKGSMQVVYEGRDVIGGHPCGRFSVKGEFSVREADMDGSKRVGDLSITSGKVWLSLIHPVVLREELEQVISFSTESGGVMIRMQGAANCISTCEWKPGT